MIGLRGGISLSIALILCAALAVIGWGAGKAAERTIVPEVAAKAEVVAHSAAALVGRALKDGIPADRLVGVAAYFDGLRAENPELAEIRLVGAGGEMARSGAPPSGSPAPTVSAPVAGANDAAGGEVVITVDPGVVSRQVAGVLLDVAFIGIVSLLVALELVALVVGMGGIEALAAVERRVRALARGQLARHEAAGGARAEPLTAPFDREVAALAARHAAARDAAARRGDGAALDALDALSERTGIGRVEAAEGRAAGLVRPALFLFMLAEELTRPFLPRFAQTLAPADGLIGPGTAASLPIVAFMAMVALCQIPFAGLSERLGRRTGFLLGALLAAAGYLLSALAAHYGVFLAARVISATGYALVFVSAQGHVIDHAQGRARSSALAVFVRAIMVASLCGPPVGGVIADRLGAGTAFAVSAGFALLALLVAALTLPKGEGTRRAGSLSLADLGAAARTPRLMALLAGCAFPAKFLFAGLSFLLVPLELQQQGFSSAAIGRFQMIYPVIMVVGVPLFAALADRTHARDRFVMAGGLVAGLGALCVPLHPSLMLLVAALALLGLGQAMSIASQSALVADMAAQAPRGGGAGVLGLFRLIERSGNAAGPASAGLLMAGVGFAGASGLMGLLVVAGALLFALSGRGAAAGREAPGAERAAQSEGSPL